MVLVPFRCGKKDGVSVSGRLRRDDRMVRFAGRSLLRPIVIPAPIA